MKALFSSLAASVTISFLANLPTNAQEKSVNTGINKTFEIPDLKDYLKKFEGESREIASQGKEIVTACKLKPGMTVARPTEEMWAFMNASTSKVDATPTEQIGNLKKLGARITLDEQSRVISVNLGECRVTDADLVHLKGLHHLQELDLTRTKITGVGLVNIKDLPALRKLFLTETKVDDAGIGHLKGMKTIGLIGLSGTTITDAALDHLRELMELRRMFCLGTGVTAAGLEKLKRALPKCQITH